MPPKAQGRRSDEHRAQDVSEADEKDHGSNGSKPHAVKEEVEEEGEANSGEHLLESVSQRLHARGELLARLSGHALTGKRAGDSPEGQSAASAELLPESRRPPASWTVDHRTLLRKIPW